VGVEPDHVPCIRRAPPTGWAAAPVHSPPWREDSSYLTCPNISHDRNAGQRKPLRRTGGRPQHVTTPIVYGAMLPIENTVWIAQSATVIVHVHCAPMCP